MNTAFSNRLGRIMRKLVYLFSIPLALLFVTCNPDEDITPASVEVNKVEIVPSYTTARITATITANVKLSNVAAELATYADFRDVQAYQLATDGKTGRYNTTADGLTASTTYFVRFRVTGKANSITNNDVFEFTTLDNSVPQVQTHSVYDISDKTATVSAQMIDNGGDNVTEYGVCWGTTETPTTQNEHKSLKSITNNEYNIAISNLQPNTTYYVCAYAINSKGIGYGEVLSFITCGVPVVLTDEVTDIDLTSATVGGTIQSDGRSAITEKGICYGLDATPTIETAQKIVSQVKDSMYRIPLVNLQDETVYYVRAYAINGVGIAYGNVRQFRTVAPELPTVATNTVGNITVTTAVAGGTITSDGGGGISERGVCYSTQPNPTVSGPHTSDGFGSGSFSSSITGLQPATQYYVRAYATNKKGVAYGEQVTFTTNDYTLPVVGATIVEDTKFTTADVSASVSTSAESPITQCGFVYATHVDPQLSDLHVEQTAVGEQITAQLHGLIANTLYYVCAYAINIKGVQYGPAATFTTKAYSLPTVVTTSASAITYTGFTIGGDVQSDGGQTVTARGICYSSTTTEPTLEHQVVQKGAGSGSYSANLTGLEPGTVYYARAYATNSIGTSYGEIMQVTTLAYGVPTVSTTDASNISFTSATVGGMVSDGGGVEVTERGVCWGLTSNPIVTDNHIAVGQGTGSFTTSITSLMSGKTYYVRAYATNSIGTAYGNQISFTTAESGALNGAFSVSGTKQVRFSKGNLQYKASTNIWRFAENQWDYVGQNNENRSATYNDWIDLFAWGTSGYNNKYPWKYGQSDHSGTDYAFGDGTDITGTMFDWGVYNAISNGGNQANLWFTMTYDEFNYLLNTRTKASQLRAYATVNDVRGFILLPDNWQLPDGVTFTPMGSYADINNIYNAEQWEIMENAGAVFLPAAGKMYNNSNGQYVWTGFGTSGAYWTSSFHQKIVSTYMACTFAFWVSSSPSMELTHGYYDTQFIYVCPISVRLVQVVQ